MRLNARKNRAPTWERGFVNFSLRRRGWDSNPRWLVTTLDFESSTLNRSDTSPRMILPRGIAYVKLYLSQHLPSLSRIALSLSFLERAFNFLLQGQVSCLSSAGALRFSAVEVSKTSLKSAANSLFEVITAHLPK